MEDFLVKNQAKIIETACFSVAPLATLIAARAGLKPWLKFNIFMNIMAALVIIFCPATIFKHLLSVKLDMYHLHLCTFTGALVISRTLYPMLLINSKDESVFTGHLWANSIGYAVFTMISIHCYKFEPEWNYKILCSFGGFHLSQCLTSLYFFSKQKPRTNQTFADCINCYTKIESFKNLIYGLVFLALPNLVLLSSATDSHRVMARGCGVWMLMLGLEAMSVSDFMYLSDKKTFILSRLMGCVFTLQALLVGFYYYKSVSANRIAFVVGGNMAYSILLAMGYFSAKVTSIKKD